jgi:hypothetical protein
MTFLWPVIVTAWPNQHDSKLPHPQPGIAFKDLNVNAFCVAGK